MYKLDQFSLFRLLLPTVRLDCLHLGYLIKSCDLRLVFNPL